MAAMFMTLISVFTSCEEDYKLELPLAVAQNELTLGAGGGSTHVLVYSTGDWTATLKNPADAAWATIDMGSGSGNGEFIFSFTKNPGIPRKAVVVLTTGSDTKEIAMEQSGFVTAAEMVFMKKSFRMPGWEAASAVAFDTNLGLALDRITSKVEYGDFDTAEGADNSAVETTPATADNPGWLTGVVVEEDSVRFNVAANSDGMPRKARITLSARNTVSGRTYTTSTIVVQDADGGYIRFNAPDQVAEVESFAKTVSFLWDTNMEMFFNRMNVDVVYDEPGEEWITGFVMTPQGLQANILESHYDGERHASITVSYNGSEGSVTAVRSVLQVRPALEVSFSDLRARLASAGTVNLERDYIMAQVISEPGNPNLETNPHTAWNQCDLTESARTAYVQSIDGAYGLRVKLADIADMSALPRYATVKIALAGLTLEREDTPARYTLRGFSASNILEMTEGTVSSLPAKERHIGQLTDNDIYTFVTFKDMEVSLRYGSWGNLHNGYPHVSDLISVGDKSTHRADCMPRFFRDINGDVIPMLVNAETPWRCEGVHVPKGSGTVKAIVVYAPLDRQKANGEMGDYQIRVLSREDINLHATQGFSTVIAEWQWNSSADIKKGTDSESKVYANTGTGVMDTDCPLTGTKTALTAGFFNLTFATKNLTNAFRYCGPWWNFTDKKGYSISWTFSTEGLSGSNLAMMMTCASGLQAVPVPVPTYWHIEYSTDGTKFTMLKKNLIIYPCPVWAYEKGDCPAGNAEYIIDLPDSLFGQKSVTVRMRAASAKMTTKDGLAKGTVKATTAKVNDQYMRFDAITIKYNK